VGKHTGYEDILRDALEATGISEEDLGPVDYIPEELDLANINLELPSEDPVSENCSILILIT
jgi:hypothetical protein